MAWLLTWLEDQRMSADVMWSVLDRPADACHIAPVSVQPAPRGHPDCLTGEPAQHVCTELMACWVQFSPAPSTNQPCMHVQQQAGSPHTALAVTRTVHTAKAARSRHNPS